ncbi:unnamed protein product [Aureobasidium uvarum]|uniref:BHLH domain-containing protein n=1 Tax=Aureobasidium uvarum TaxID=2773716 RepID=A0A9N8PTV7_9PEZI|nr:unnamed protein product [Aureobasidium uvarum]
MGMQYQPMYPTVDNDTNMQPFFVGPPQPQPQPQFYGFPPPTGSSLDSGYAGEDINPFEDNGLCSELKMDYVQHIAPAIQSFDTFGYMTNDQQPNIPGQPFVPVNYSGPFAHSFEPVEQDMNMSQSPPTPTLVPDDAISVKSEDMASDAASPMTLTHPRSRLPKQNKRRPSTIRRTATEPSMEIRSGSIQRTAAKEGRGRGRKRIPHTAVERRYRENLNTHLENLRHAMPFLQAAQRRRASDVNDPMKPSKCEILIGGLAYIKRLESEVKELKERLGE